jgi:hypothetical protein
MGLAIRCILEQELPGIPDMEGKSLCMAFCGETGDGQVADASPATNVVPLDFGGPRTPAPRPPASQISDASDELLFVPLGEFITGMDHVQWHDPTAGLVAVRGILTKLRAGASVQLDPSFDFFGDDVYEFTASVTFDLETLEEILVAAQSEQIKFRLMIDA